jgi:hypothetical protein
MVDWVEPDRVLRDHIICSRTTNERKITHCMSLNREMFLLPVRHKRADIPTPQSTQQRFQHTHIVEFRCPSTCATIKVPYFEDAVGGGSSGYVESSIHWQTDGNGETFECHTVFVPVTIAHTSAYARCVSKQPDKKSAIGEKSPNSWPCNVARTKPKVGVCGLCRDTVYTIEITFGIHTQSNMGKGLWMNRGCGTRTHILSNPHSDR